MDSAYLDVLASSCNEKDPTLLLLQITIKSFDLNNKNIGKILGVFLLLILYCDGQCWGSNR